MNLENLIDGLKNRDKRSISKVLSEIENASPLSEKLIDEVSSKSGYSYRIGITGPPGAGKSTLTNQLVKLLISKNYSVGVIAIDPTSPFTGGALLGDRIRMVEVGTHPDVFIRSMATRGSLGGLNKVASEVVDVFDYCKFDYTIFETVGVGQSELDIANNVDSTVVVLVPESGDSIQAMKAGLMEIGDIFVINKADRAGADQAVSTLQFILSFKDHDENSWIPPIVKTIAQENKGIDELYEKLNKHKEFLLNNGLIELKRINRIKNKIKDLVSIQLRKELWTDDRLNILNGKISQIMKGKTNISTTVKELVENFKNSH